MLERRELVRQLPQHDCAGSHARQKSAFGHESHARGVGRPGTGRGTFHKSQKREYALFGVKYGRFCESSSANGGMAGAAGSAAGVAAAAAAAGSAAAFGADAAVAAAPSSVCSSPDLEEDVVCELQKRRTAARARQVRTEKRREGGRSGVRAHTCLSELLSSTGNATVAGAAAGVAAVGPAAAGAAAASAASPAAGVGAASPPAPPFAPAPAPALASALVVAAVLVLSAYASGGPASTSASALRSVAPPRSAAGCAPPSSIRPSRAPRGGNDDAARAERERIDVVRSEESSDFAAGNGVGKRVRERRGAAKRGGARACGGKGETRAKGKRGRPRNGCNEQGASRTASIENSGT